MPDEQRIDMTRDLTPEGYARAEPLIEEMVTLEQEWVKTGDEDAYEKWRSAVTKLQAIVNEHHASERL